MIKCRKLVMPIVLTILAGCSDSKIATNSISGTAAIGAPMAEAAIKFMDGDGCVANGYANGEGFYTVALGNCSGPFFVSAQSAAGTVYSVATDEDLGGVVNITPLTQVIASRVFGTNNLETVEQDIETALSSVTSDKVDAETTKVAEAIQVFAAKFGAELVDIRTGVFTANGTGIDKVLDSISVRPTGSDLEMEIKGSGGTKITIPASDVAIDHANFHSAIADTADLVMTEFAEIKKIFKKVNSSGQDINDCFDGMDKTCFDTYLHTSFKSDGYVEGDATSGYWFELVDEDQSMYIRVANPYLIEMNSSRDAAWVASDYFEKQANGTYKKAWLDITKFKKDGGIWKVYGNQNPYPYVIQSSVIKHEDGSVEKALNVRIFNFAAMSDSYTTKIEASEIGVTSTNLVSTRLYNAIDIGYERLKPAANAVTCAATNIFCEPFVKQTQLTSPNFVKVKVDYDSDGTYEADEEQMIISTPSLTSEFPSFVQTAASFCGTFNPASTYPATLDWTLPDGYMTETMDLLSIVTGYEFDQDLLGIKDGTLGYDSVSIPLRASLIPVGASAADLSDPFNVSLQTAMLRSINEYGRNYFVPMSCGSP